MDAFKLLNAVPFGELVRAQRILGLTAVQMWYIATYWSVAEEGDTELADITGVSRSTIRDVRQSLAAMGLYCDTNGFAPLIAELVKIRGRQEGTISPSTPLLTSLDAYEQLLVLDQFACRICYSKWNINGAKTEFRMTKVGNGETILTSRMIVCTDCSAALKESETVERLKLYIAHRMIRLRELEGYHITEAEQSNLERIRAKKTNMNKKMETMVSASENRNTEDSPHTYKDHDQTNARNADARECRLLVNDRRAEIDTDNVDNADYGFFHDKAVKKTGETRTEPLHIRGKKSKKSISSDDEEPTEELENAEHSKLPTTSSERRASKRAQDILERHTKRLEKLKTIPCDQWSTHDMTIFYWDKHYRKYGYAQAQEVISERQKHISALLLALDGSVEEFIKFTNWIMNNWHTLPFIREDITPTTRNVAIRMGDILPHYHGGTRDIAIKQTKANPHIDSAPVDIPDWAVKGRTETPETTNGEETKRKLPDWAR